MGVRRGAASPASAAGVNGGGGEVGEEDEMRVEAWKAGREATTRRFDFRGFSAGVAPLGWNECGGRICPYRHAAKFWEEKPKRR